MWGKFKTFFLSNLYIAATDRLKLPRCPKLPQMTVVAIPVGAASFFHCIIALPLLLMP